MSITSGQIDINISTASGNNEGAVSILTERPVHLSKMFVGKKIKDVLNIIPLVYNVCGVAHSKAALSATESIYAIDVNRKKELAREIILTAESLKENLLRIFLDWPRILNFETNQKPLPFLTELTNKTKNALFKNGDAFKLDSRLEIDIESIENQFKRVIICLEEDVFGIPYREWAAFESYHELELWSRSQDEIAAFSVRHIVGNDWSCACYSGVGGLPVLDRELLQQRFASINCDEFICRPDWQGATYETTSLTRNVNNSLIKELFASYKNGLLTRWVARLTEIVALLSNAEKLIHELNCTEKEMLASNTHSSGLAEVDAARGKLIHFIRLSDDLVSDYRILAPTEWNFHPQGVVQRSLSDLCAGVHRGKRQLIEMFINAVDPCVAYNLRIS